jgi:ABC-type uncharacterized transport system substrate-binding protein
VRPLRACLLFVALCAAGHAPHATAQVTLLLSERGPPYSEVAAALARQLSSPPLEAADAESVVRGRPSVAVAIGTQACVSLATSALQAPLLCVLVPRITFEGIAAPARAMGKTLSAIVLDQPAARQMALIRTALPDRRQVGVLLGPQPALQPATLTGAASRHGLRLSSVLVARAEDVGDGLQRLLSESEVLLAVPDSVVFSPGNVQNILRSALERQVPLVGFSPAFARAGALLAVYSTPQQIGEQAGQWLRQLADGAALPPPQSPRSFEVAANRHVARSLGIQLDDEKVIAERVRALEAAP